MEFNVLSAFKGIEKEAINPFNPNEVGTSLFLNGGMGQKIKENTRSQEQLVKRREEIEERMRLA